MPLLLSLPLTLLPFPYPSPPHHRPPPFPSPSPSPCHCHLPHIPIFLSSTNSPPFGSIFRHKPHNCWRHGCSLSSSSSSDNNSGHGDEVEERKGGGTEGRDLEQEMAIVLEDEESRALLRDLAAAQERVAAARRELDLITDQEKRLAELKAQLELLNATQATSNKLVADSEKEVAAAELELAAAELALVTARAGDSLRTLPNMTKSKEVDENLERINSIQTASVSALVGVSASLPFAIVTDHGLDLNFFVSEGSIFISCALFGVCFRYIIRRDLDNIQLKTGAAAAFALVRGLGQIETTQLLADCSADGCHEVLRATLNAGQSLFIFFSAALVLDYCFKKGLLKPFAL